MTLLFPICGQREPDFVGKGMAHWMVDNLAQVPQWEAEISQGKPKKLFSGMLGKLSNEEV